MYRIKLILSFILIIATCNVFSQKNTPELNADQPTVGLVLSGGGAKGFAYIGLLKVLEEVNMPIDYIGGSSIGAIVAGLYSVGYSPQTIEELIREQDWDIVITDVQERKYLSYEEKLFSDKYIFSIPVKDSSISLSQSISTSFNIDLMLNRLFAPSAHISDFSKLPIPFLCIGTDLLSGNAVVLDSGNVARAIRASMAIPGYFTPILYQGHYLVDGGVVNNYPAEQIKAKGVNFVIGGDVQSGLKSTIEELNSATSILDQIISFNRIDANNIGLELTDYYIKIKLPYGMMDFTKYDSIIAYGEKTARLHYKELKQIADSINELRNTVNNRKDVAIADSIYIDNVQWRDIKWKQKDKFNGYFNELENKNVSFNDIEERMRLLNGTKSFNELYYLLKTDKENNTNLKIIADEPSIGSLSAGLHYDNIYLGSALINVALRKNNGGRSKLFADFVLGQNPRLNTLYIINRGFKPGFGLETDLYAFRFPEYRDGKKINTWNFDNINAAIFMPLTIKNDFLFKTGFQYELFRFKQDVEVDTTLNTFSEFANYGNIFISFNLDTRDKVYFTESGQKIDLQLKHVFPFSNKWDDFISNSTIAYLSYQQSLKLSKELVLNPGFFLGYTFIKEEAKPTPYESDLETSSPIQHLFGFGGLNPNNYIENHIPFTGLRYIERFGQYAGILSADLQYNFYKKLYITVMADVGINEMELTDIIADNILLGAGIKLSYNSFIGPVEFSVMNSNVNQGVTGFLNLGFWF